MARLARAVFAGLPHHVTQRGNNQENVFFHARDRDVYLDALFDYAIRYHLDIWGYCLMTNHVHFIVVPNEENALARVFGRTHSDYARYAHAVYRGCGHLWQARFYSCVLERDHAWAALAYVERNPVRGALTMEASSYAWSSAARHCGGRSLRRQIATAEWEREFTPERWREVLKTSLVDEQLRDRLREATMLGYPLGSAGFVSLVGQQLGRDVARRLPGRPRKESSDGGVICL